MSRLSFLFLYTGKFYVYTDSSWKLASTLFSMASQPWLIAHFINYINVLLKNFEAEKKLVDKELL